MKTQDPLPPQSPRNGSISSKTRLTIILASLVAFVLAFSLFILLDAPDEAEMKAVTPGIKVPAEALNGQEIYPHVPGRIILRIEPQFRTACTPRSIQIPTLERQFQEIGVHRIRKNFPQAEPIIGEQRNNYGQQLVDLSLIYELELDSTVDIPSLASNLSQHPAVMYAEPRYIYEVFHTPDDTYLSYQWYLDTMRVREAWDYTKGDTNIVIGIIDTGTDFNHEELDGDRIAYNYADPVDGIDNDNDGYIDNYRGWDFGGNTFWAPADNNPNYVGTGPGMDHGVLVAGVACAEANNGKAIAGTGYHTRYLPLKASVDQSLGISYGMDAIVYAADHNVGIVNLSWGSGAVSTYGQNVVNYAAINKGCLLVGAAGNQHSNTFIYPASYEHVISTAATQTGDMAWDQGTGTGTSYNFLVDICAPGRQMITTTGGGGVWSGSTGTSMSAPVVCAIAALVKAKYPALDNVQAGEMVRSTAIDIYNNNPGLLERLGKGRADALLAVTQTGVKSVRLDTMLVQGDINNIPEPFDTLNITGKFINYLDPTQNLEINLSSPNPEYIEVIQGSSTIGAMATKAYASTPTPLRIVIKKSVTVPTKLWLRFGISDGSYQDFQYRELIIYPHMIDLDANRAQTTINGCGNFGYVDYPGFLYGLGYQHDSHFNIIRDAGFLVGISSSNVVDMTRNEYNSRDTDFEPLIKPYRVTPAPEADLEAHARFSDMNAGSQMIGLDISQHAYQYAGGGQDQYVIMEYVIRNTNNYPINGAYAGLSAQWSRIYYNCSDAQFLPNAGAVAAKFDATGTSFYAGISLLTDQQVNAFVTTEPQFNFTSQAKFDALRNQPGSLPPVSGDVLEFISAGPFNLAAGDSTVVAFALVGAPDLPTFEVVSTTALQQYQCVIHNQTPQVNLGNDIITCGASSSPPTFDAGAGTGLTYSWNTGETTQTISPTADGDYSVTVTNTYGCQAIDSVSLRSQALNSFNITTPNNNYLIGAPASFSIADPNNLIDNFAWDFGDGNTSTAASPTHTYAQPGTYNVTVAISNANCSSSLSLTVTVSTPTSLNGRNEFVVKLYPNPVQSNLQLQMSDNFTGNVYLEMYDNSGKQVLRKTMQKTGFELRKEVDVAHLAKGMYIAKIRAGEQVFSDKIIKQ